MEPINDEFSDMMLQSYGEPQPGFAELLKSCEVLDPLNPTTSPSTCKGYKTPEGVPLHRLMMQGYHDMKTMKVREDDIFVITYPKCGTTWAQEITWLLANNADIEKANSKPTDERVPFTEFTRGGVRKVEAMPESEQRILKSHLPYDALPESIKKNKIIYVVRNLKDTTVSYYHFLKMLKFFSYSGTVKEFVDLVVSEKVLYGSFAKHVLDFWTRRRQDNILFITYEELSKDLKAGVAKIAKFLGKTYTDQQISDVAKHCSFDSMKNNPMSNHARMKDVENPESTGFFRKGKVSDWRNHFDEEMSQKIDDYIEKHFKDSGLEFEYQI